MRSDVIDQLIYIGASPELITFATERAAQRTAQKLKNTHATTPDVAVLNSLVEKQQAELNTLKEAVALQSQELQGLRNQMAFFLRKEPDDRHVKSKEIGDHLSRHRRRHSA